MSNDKNDQETTPNNPTPPQFPVDRTELNDIPIAPQFPNDRIEKGEKPGELGKDE